MYWEQLEDREAGNTNSVVSAQLQAIAGKLRHICACAIMYKVNQKLKMECRAGPKGTGDKIRLSQA